MAAAIIALIWFGMLIGVSFLATPVKFVVHDLSLPVALQVGQATFALFSRVEWGFAAILFGVCLWMARTRPTMLALATLVASAVLAEAVWLLPALDARVDAIVAGNQPPSSSHHTLYAALEALKAVLLAALAFLGLRRSPARSPCP
ncbi:MAG: hypothetical protein R3C52_04115 [Hyphomonadaceae bacterium]